MSSTALVHIHFTFVILFLLFFGIKALLLLTNQKGMLRSVRNKGKIFDMILGIGILTTGLYLASRLGFSFGWIHVKITLLVIALPLGIIGLKKENKVLTVIALLLLLYMYYIGESKGYKFWASDTLSQPSSTLAVKSNGVVFDEANCSRFHGSAVDQEKTISLVSATTNPFIAQNNTPLNINQ